MREFPASYDSMAKAVSALVSVVIFAGPFLAQFWPMWLFSAIVLILCYGYSPRGYLVGQGSIRVRRFLKDAEIPLERVLAVRRATPEDLKWAIRLWGSGGFFGYYGIFRTSKLGKCTWYSTRRTAQVVVITETQTALFSPDDIDGFLTAVRAEAPGMIPPPLEEPAIAPRTGAGSYAWILAAVALPGLLLGIAAVTYSPGLPDINLTRDTLEIRDRFYPVTLARDSVDLAAARTITISDPEWRIKRRTNGFANSHYRSGWFLAANGKTVRMYRATGNTLVLLPARGEGDTVLLEVAGADDFLSRIRREWGAAN